MNAEDFKSFLKEKLTGPEFVIVDKEVDDCGIMCDDYDFIIDYKEFGNTYVKFRCDMTTIFLIAVYVSRNHRKLKQIVQLSTFNMNLFESKVNRIFAALRVEGDLM